MITKDALMEKTDALIDQLRGEQISFIVLLFSPGGPSKIDSYAEKLIDFQKEIRTSEDDDETVLELHKKYIVLERTTKRRAVILGALPSVMTLYVAIAALGILVTSVDIPKFIESTLGVKAPGKLITLGIAGAFVYLATTGLSRTETHSAGFSSVLHHTIRFSLAIVVPIILVVLFFNETGNLKEVTVSPELLSFGCGYSAKLVVELFNKIVEKGSKMVAAL
jgi:hypothetical protein